MPPPLLPPLIVAAALLLFALLFLFAVSSYRLRKKTVPADLIHRYSFAVLRRATDSFSAANRLGQGGFGSVYKGVLPSGQVIAVKLMTNEPSNNSITSTTQGDLEFQNELNLAASCADVPHVVSVLGFSTSDGKKDWSFHRRGRRLALVYEYMANGSLQDALLNRKCVELMDWNKRFQIVLSIAKGLHYLHHCCDPPIVHCDIKPSNVLLDANFDAKIADFGLAQLLTINVAEKKKADCCGSMIAEENETHVAGDALDFVNVNVESYCVGINIDGVEASPPPSEHLEKEGSVSEGMSSVDSGNRNGVRGKGKSESRRDWWWKQENVNGLSDSGRVKDYVMEWIGSEINKERPSNKDWVVKSSSSVDLRAKVEQGKKKLEWWASLDRETMRKEKKNKEPREWWKEEYCDELSKKKKTRGDSKFGNEGELWWQKDEDEVPERKRRKSRGSRNSMDRWLDGFSGEFRLGRRHSQDWTSGEIPKSGGISSTPSMRGTVCYIAPEHGGGAPVSDKTDVYSFGVLLLVMLSGRRPLHVMASPVSDFERSNLISWARQLALNGKLLELVDSNIQLLDREQALLCVTIAILCLQRSPNKRPTMKEIVEMLSGRSEAPHLPFEFSPSPPSIIPFNSWKKPR